MTGSAVYYGLLSSGESGIWGSSRVPPVRSLHPRLRTPGAYVPTGHLPIGTDYGAAIWRLTSSMRRIIGQGLRLSIITVVAPRTIP